MTKNKCVVRGCNEKEYVYPWGLCRAHAIQWVREVEKLSGVKMEGNDAEALVVDMANKFAKGFIKKEFITKAYEVVRNAKW